MDDGGEERTKKTDNKVLHGASDRATWARVLLDFHTKSSYEDQMYCTSPARIVTFLYVSSEDLQVVIWDIISYFPPFLDQLIGHYSSLWGIMPNYHVECPISSFLYVNGT